MDQPIEHAPIEEKSVELRVSGQTGTKDLAKSISSILRQGKSVSLVGIGHSALGQAIKAIPVVNGFWAPKGVIYAVLPSFEERQVDDGTDGDSVTRTVVRLQLIQYTLK